MATTSHLNDIDDKFCLCSICLEQLKEPKQLPCLHRYCRDCLRSIIQGSHDVIKCPECREEIEIPTNSVNGFKTDFYLKCLVEYVQIQQSLKSDEIRECYCCSKHVRVAAYCFKCNDFLCKECHKFHLTSKMMKDHQKHTLSLEDTEAEKITIEKLVSMRDAPRCHTHPGKVSELLCETCDNTSVCIVCTYGKHKGHVFHEVNTLAKLKRAELAEKLKALEVIEKDKMSFLPGEAKQKLMLNANIDKEKLIKIHDENDQEIITKIKEIERRIQQVKQEKQNAEKKIFDSLQREMDQEIQDIKKKYDDIFQVKKSEPNDSFNMRQRSLEEELGKLNEKRERFRHDKKHLLQSIEKQLNENLNTIETISEYFDNIKKRFETLKVMASSILASENDWPAVQCIPDMCTAATNLMEDLKTDFPELSTVTDVIINYNKYFCVKPSVITISDEVKRQIPIDDPYWYVNGMTSSGDGNIVISGNTSNNWEPFIIVIDINGRILQEKKFTSTVAYPFRYCKYLTQHKVASVCRMNEVGLFDVRDGSYIKKNISDVINSWPEDRDVHCVATDPVNNHILVGGFYSRDVCVFDDQLNYLHVLTLPEMIKRPRDMAVSDGYLLVCDYDGGKCYVTTMNGLESKVVGQFKGQNLEGNNCKPISVRTDENGFVYILWWMRDVFDDECYLVQYNQDGSQVLTTRKMDGDARVITVAETSQGEKLAVATYKTQTVFLYDLITEE